MGSLEMAETILIKGAISNEVISSQLKSLGEKTGLGGHSVFIGQVRADISGGKKVKAIEYSAYQEMADREARNIIEAILSEYDDVSSVNILHSVGFVMTGEVSLFVLVSAGHRRHAIEACSKTVELIKERLPVWKKEIFEDDTHEWKQNSTV